MNAILMPDFTQPESPEPPPGAVRWQAQQAKEAVNADMHAEARLRYGNRLPIVLPYWYSMDDIVDRVHGFNRQPQFIGKVGTRISAFRKRDNGVAGQTGAAA